MSVVFFQTSFYEAEYCTTKKEKLRDRLFVFSQLFYVRHFFYAKYNLVQFKVQKHENIKTFFCLK
jgi:hypothetical protein